MKTEKIGWGLLLLAAGSVLLLKNIALIDFDWHAVWRFWSVVVIVIGFNLLVPRSVAGRIASLLVFLAAIAFFVYTGISSANADRRQWESVQEKGAGQQSGRQPRSGNLTPPYFKNSVSQSYSDSVKKAVLTIEGGAVNYVTGDPTEAQLFHAESRVAFGPHHLLTLLPSRRDSTVRMRFRLGQRGEKGKDLTSERSKVTIHLHEEPVWDITLKMAVGKADFDFEKFKVSGLRLQCGAASVRTRLGHPIGETEVQVESGAASVRLEVPRSSVCRILVSSNLSSRHFEGFTAQPDGSYQTEGYGEAGDRFDIHLRGGVTSFVVQRYD